MGSVPAIIGHRGARGEAPENTLAGFRQAVGSGADGIELDVRLSSDGHLVVLHDAGLRRTTGDPRRAHRITRSELGGLDARRDTPGWHSPAGVPSLEEVIEACPDDTHFQFEVKATRRATLERIAAELARLVERHDMHHRCVISSSHAPFLEGIGREYPALRRGYVCRRSFRLPVLGSRLLGSEWLILHYRLVTPWRVARARKQGLKLSVWTVNDLSEAERLAALGVDSLITDFPSAFVAHFRGPGRHSRDGAPPPLDADAPEL